MKQKRKPRKREPAPFCPDPRQLDLIEFINNREKQQAFAKLDEAIRRTLEESNA